MKRAIPYLLSSSAYIAGIGLTVTSAWLITMASFRPPLVTLGIAIVGVRFFGISRSVARYFERLSSHSVVFARLSQLRVRLYNSVTNKPLTLVRDLSSGTLVKRIVDDVERVQEYELRITMPHVAAAISLATAILLGAWILPLSIAVTLPCAIALLFVVPIFAKTRCEVLANEIEKLEGEYSSLLEQSAHGLAEARFYGYLDERVQRTLEIETRILEREKMLFRVNRTFQFATTSIFGFTLVLLALLANNYAARLPAVRVSMLIFLPLVMFEAISMWYPNLFAAGKLLLARSEVAMLLVEDVVNENAKTDLEVPVEVLVARNVQAKWGQGEHFMEPVSFTVRQGQCLVIRGRSGSGKSTLAMALLGLLDYDGEISINGLDARTLESGHIVGAVQNTHIFSTSVRENLKIAAPQATDDELRSVLRVVELDSLVDEMEEGLDTLIGAFGRALSGGEAKRLSLARALLSKADIVVLDEPTEHLDSDLAHRIEGRILGMKRIFIVITHSGWESAETTLHLVR